MGNIFKTAAAFLLLMLEPLLGVDLAQYFNEEVAGYVVTGLTALIYILGLFTDKPKAKLKSTLE